MKLGPYRLRRDKNTLAVFDTRNGKKIRYAFGTCSDNFKATRPELADLKITDYCDFGCRFCYQGSTVRGKHAPLWNVLMVANRLARAKTFEVAIGGGEPTKHPDFIDILKYFRNDCDIVPNFTTRNLPWMEENWHNVLPLIGGWAYSMPGIATADGIKEGFRSLPDLSALKRKMNLHYVMGLASRPAFALFLQSAWMNNVRVTLLGYKSIGRGKNVIPVPYPWLIDELVYLRDIGRCPTVSIDTPLAAQFEDELVQKLCDRNMFHTEEGKTSVYVDCVNMTFGPSSFEDVDNLIPFGDDWLEKYKDM